MLDICNRLPRSRAQPVPRMLLQEVFESRLSRIVVAQIFLVNLADGK